MVRALHVAASRDVLPDRIGIYFHSLEPQDWEEFERVVRFFREEQGYQLTDASGFLARLPARRLFISFDDNYHTWYESRRLFARLDVRVSFYVNTLPFLCELGSNELVDYYKRLKHSGWGVPLGRGAIRELLADGHTIGAHTHSHFVLATIPEAQAIWEITHSKLLLEEILEVPIIHFAYPYGMRRHFSESLRSICLRVGFKTIANGIPGLQFASQRHDRIQRSPWLLHRSFEHNLSNLKIDGRLFERITGRSAVV